MPRKGHSEEKIIHALQGGAKQGTATPSSESITLDRTPKKPTIRVATLEREM